MGKELTFDEIVALFEEDMFECVLCSLGTVRFSLWSLAEDIYNRGTLQQWKQVLTSNIHKDSRENNGEENLCFSHLEILKDSFVDAMLCDVRENGASAKPKSCANMCVECGVIKNFSECILPRRLNSTVSFLGLLTDENMCAYRQLIVREIGEDAFFNFVKVATMLA